MTTDLGSLPWRRAQWAAYQGPGAGYALGPTFFLDDLRVRTSIAFIKNMASTGIVTSRQYERSISSSSGTYGGEHKQPK